MNIVVALGGGGARGFAHLGVLRRLEEEGFKIRAISGTSAGGIMAAVYAAGFSPSKLEMIFSQIDQTRLFARGTKEGPGILGLSTAEKLLDEYLGDRQFSDLKIPCSMTAVDIDTGREVVLAEGRVVDAVLATIAIPGVFPPKVLGKYHLVDGGVLDPVPVSLARQLAPKLPVVAVVLSPQMEQPGRFASLPLPVRVPQQIVERLTKFRIAQAFNIFMESIDIGSRMITELRLEIDKPEIIIRPQLSEIGMLEKVDVRQIARLGELATEEILPELFRVVAWPNQWIRQFFFSNGSRRQKNTAQGVRIE